MKRYLLLAWLLIIPLSVPAAQGQVVEIGVVGMSCEFCAYGVEKKLKGVPGVEQAKVSLDDGKAWIVMAPGQVADLATLRKAIEAAGFTPGEVHGESQVK